METNSLLYRSYYYDQETSYYYLNSRYYCPKNARFQIVDEITYLGITGTVNSYNLFSYCENEPINHMDEDGHEGLVIVAIGGLILAIAFLVSYFATLSYNRSRGNYGGTY